MVKLIATQIVVAAFNDSEKASQVSKALCQAVSEKVIPPFRNMVVTQTTESGKVKVTEMGHVTAFAAGAVGGLVGGLSCLLLGPFGVAAGAAAGALIGNMGAKALVEGSLDKSRVHKMANSLPESSSGLIVVFEEAVLEKEIWKSVEVQQVADEMVYELSQNMGETLRQGQDVAYLYSVTEDGLVAARMASGNDVEDIQGLFAASGVILTGTMGATADMVAYEFVGIDGMEATYQAGVLEATDGAGGDERKLEKDLVGV